MNTFAVRCALLFAMAPLVLAGSLPNAADAGSGFSSAAADESRPSLSVLTAEARSLAAPIDGP